MLGRQSAASDRNGAAPDAGARDEVRLLGRVAEGDLRAFEDLYRIYHPRLTRFLFNMTRRSELVEEVLNDTMMVVWNRPCSYNGASKLSTWIFAIAYRKALKALHNQDVPLEDRQAELRPSGEAGPEQQLGRLQVSEILLTAIDELSPAQRAVVDLSYFHEMGYREIAEIVDCPVDTVKTRMFHARRRLRDRLSGRLDDWL